MNKKKLQRLLAGGWTIGSPQSFLGLSAAEKDDIERKLAKRKLARVKRNLTLLLKQRRKQLGMSQSRLAETMGSSQSRIAKLEGGDPAFSMDLAVFALLCLGVSPEDISSAILQA